MGSLYYLAFSFIAGGLVAIQPGMNITLGKTIGSPIWAAVVSGVVAALVLTVYALFTASSVPDFTAKTTPYWMWMGGLIGGFFVASTVIAPPVTGVALFLAAVVAGQMIIGLAVDHYGLAGMTVHPINAMRVLGGLLILGGVILIQKF